MNGVGLSVFTLSLSLSDGCMLFSLSSQICTATHYAVREYEVVIMGRQANHTMSALVLAATGQG